MWAGRGQRGDDCPTLSGVKSLKGELRYSGKAKDPHSDNHPTRHKPHFISSHARTPECFRSQRLDGVAPRREVEHRGFSREGWDCGVYGIGGDSTRLHSECGSPSCSRSVSLQAC